MTIKRKASITDSLPTTPVEATETPSSNGYVPTCTSHAVGKAVVELLDSWTPDEDSNCSMIERLWGRESLDKLKSLINDSKIQKQNLKEIARTLDAMGGDIRKRVVVLGKTGSGKSSLCNALSGNHPAADTFAVTTRVPSPILHSEVVYFKNDPQKSVRIIDTIGLDDTTMDVDKYILNNLLLELRKDNLEINFFAVVINGQSLRLNKTLIAMFQSFERLFGEDFWPNAVLLFTKRPMDRKNKIRRMKTGSTDDETAANFCKSLRQIFAKCDSLKYLYLDAHYDPTDEDEKVAFDSASDNLWNLIASTPGAKIEKTVVQSI